MTPMRFMGNKGNSSVKNIRPIHRDHPSIPALTFNLEQRHQKIKGNPVFSNTYLRMKQNIKLELTHPQIKEQKSIEKTLKKADKNFKHSIYNI
jgi:hypothetical protein